MKKCLIYTEKRHLKNVGGPLGYNYNLQQGLLNNEITNVTFLDTQMPKSEVVSKSIKRDSNSIKYRLFYNGFFRSLLGGLKQVYNYLLVILKIENKKNNFDEYDVIHFHSTLDLYRCQKKLASYNGIVMLTTHSPIMPSYELKREYKKWTRFLFFYIYFFGKKIDLYALKRADYILSPCENAMDSYKRYSKKYEKIVKDKFVYLLTGCINERYFEFDEESIRSKYNINKNNFNITYLGRHNKVKGYDVLKNYINKLNNYINVQVIVGGKIGPLKPPKLQNWKEIGFTSDALAIMKYSDVYVSCNRDTYFDLATLQALSVGTIVVSTRTGGNLFFEKNNIPGVYLYDDFEEFKRIILEIKNMSKSEREDLKKKIKLSFSQNFDSDTFADNYSKIINCLNKK